MSLLKNRLLLFIIYYCHYGIFVIMPVDRCIMKCDNQSAVLFTVPPDRETFMLWKRVCNDYDVDIKRGSSICANHFNGDDILYRRHIIIEGLVVGVVSTTGFRHRLVFILLLLLLYDFC